MPLSACQQHALNTCQPHPSSSPSNKTPSPHSLSPFHSVPFITELDIFGLYCTYSSKPTYILPDSLDNAYDAPGLYTGPSTERGDRQDFLDVLRDVHFSPDDIFALFSSLTSSIYLAWNQSSSNLKSGIETDHFTKIQQDPHYKIEELKNFLFTHETKQLNNFLDSKANPFHSDYGWCKSAVEIKLPRDTPSEPDIPWMKIDRVWHQDIVDIITNVFQNEAGLDFNMMLFT